MFVPLNGVPRRPLCLVVALFCVLALCTPPMRAAGSRGPFDVPPAAELRSLSPEQFVNIEVTIQSVSRRYLLQPHHHKFYGDNAYAVGIRRAVCAGITWTR